MQVYKCICTCWPYYKLEMVSDKNGLQQEEYEQNNFLKIKIPVKKYKIIPNVYAANNRTSEYMKHY